MINHARTLLLNLSGSDAHSVVGSEYVPEDFVAKTLSPELASVRRTIFGSDPDQVFMNYRVRQCLVMLHSTELDEYVRQLDNRITYDTTFKHDMVTTTAFRRSIRRVRGAKFKSHLAGDLEANEAKGRCVYRWRIRVVDADTVNVARRAHEVGDEELAVTVSGGLSSPIPLHGSSLTARLSVPAADDSLAAIIDNVYAVEGTVRPTSTLVDVAAQLRTSLSEPVSRALFGVKPAEPFKTFRNLWYDNPALPYSLGGLLMALIYRTHEYQERLR